MQNNYYFFNKIIQNSLSITMLDVFDNMKNLIPKITILHVHNPSKIYLQ